MATRLSKTVSREIVLEDAFGTQGNVILTLQTNGLTLRAKGKKRKLFFSYDKFRPDAFPVNFPARFVSNPIGWLVEKK